METEKRDDGAAIDRLSLQGLPTRAARVICEEIDRRIAEVLKPMLAGALGGAKTPGDVARSEEARVAVAAGDLDAMAISLTEAVDRKGTSGARAWLEANWPKTPPLPAEGTTRHPQWHGEYSVDTVPCEKCKCAMRVQGALCDVCKHASANVRDEAWWEEQTARVLLSLYQYRAHTVESLRKERSRDLGSAVQVLRRTFDPPAAIDVEEVARQVDQIVRQQGYTVLASLRYVLRGMGHK